MKAWVLGGKNDLQLKEVPKPIPKKDEVLLKVEAAGICSSDIPRVFTASAYHYPLILGHEFSGVTEEGRRVGVFPLIPCHTCVNCQNFKYETCANYSYIGSRQDGAFAEYVAVPKWNIIPLPEHITFEQGALLEPAAVALHAVKRAKLANATKVAVIGNGVIGRLIGIWLKHYGVEQVDVLGRGIEEPFAGYDISFEVVGHNDSFRRCIELTRPNGEIILVGNPDIDFNIDQILYWHILRKQLSISGSWNSRYPADWKSVIENADKLRLEVFISHNYKFCELNKAFEMMHTKKEKYCKVMINSFSE